MRVDVHLTFREAPTINWWNGRGTCAWFAFRGPGIVRVVAVNGFFFVGGDRDIEVGFTGTGESGRFAVGADAFDDGSPSRVDANIRDFVTDISGSDCSYDVDDAPTSEPSFALGGTTTRVSRSNHAWLSARNSGAIAASRCS